MRKQLHEMSVGGNTVWRVKAENYLVTRFCPSTILALIIRVAKESTSLITVLCFFVNALNSALKEKGIRCCTIPNLIGKGSGVKIAWNFS